MGTDPYDPFPGTDWDALPVPEERVLQLTAWQVFETEQGVRHLVGYSPPEGIGRVTSAIAAFDRRTMSVTTRSGRVYELIGTPGVNAEADRTWRDWTRVHGVVELSDVTGEYWSEGFG